tara:strand:+ start:1205 stop:1729 length:525 start_codon:yes stop_codon:yes gene_type:complete
MAENNARVTIARDEQGSVIRVSKTNPEFGHVRLTQNKVLFNTQGWVNNKQLSTLIHGTVEDLKALNLENKESLPGNIVVREQTEPFNTNDPDRDLKMAGDTGVVCCAHGEPIYRKTFYSMDENATDTLVAHTNSDAIREANGDGSSINVEKIVEEKKESKKEKEIEMEEETFEL